MRLTVLGSSASYAGPGRACSGYLVTSEWTSVLLDCGNGVLANLGIVTDPFRLDAVFITHVHPDHFLDIYAMQALLRYAPEGPAQPKDVYGPPGLCRLLGGILDEHGRAELAEAFTFRDLEPGVAISVGGLSVTPALVTHVPDTFALVVTDDAGTLCYTSDATFDDAVLEVARGADVLLAEATLPERYAGRAPHMTAAEAGRLARHAGVGALVLTHVWPTNDRSAMIEAASNEFAEPVCMAEEGAVHEVLRAAPGRQGTAPGGSDGQGRRPAGQERPI